MYRKLANGEQYVLQHEVTFRKDRGTLTLTNTKFFFKPLRSAKVIGAQLSQLEAYKVSKEIHAVGLRLECLGKDGKTKPLDFMFVGPDASADREQWVEQLKDVISLKRKKAKLLKDNPDLKDAYEGLVKGGVVSEEEFWKSREAELSYVPPEKQRKGIVSSAMVAPNVESGCNILRLQVTPELILSIFQNNPDVERIYDNNVPHKMTEQEFWGKYFTSEYFRGSSTDDSHDPVMGGPRTTLGSAKSRDIFAELAHKKKQKEHEEREGNARREKIRVDRSVDLTSSEGLFQVDDSSQLAEDKVKLACTKIIQKYNNDSKFIVESHCLSSSGSADDYARRVARQTLLHDLMEPEQPQVIHLNIGDKDVFRKHNFGASGSAPSSSSSGGGGGGGGGGVERADRAGETNPELGDRANTKTAQLKEDIHTFCETKQKEPRVSMNTRDCSSRSWKDVISDDYARASMKVLREVTNRTVAMHKADDYEASMVEKAQQQTAGDSLIGIDNSIHSGLHPASSVPQSSVVFSVSGEEDVDIPDWFRIALLSHFRSNSELLRHFWSLFPLVPTGEARLAKFGKALTDCYNKLKELRSNLNSQGHSALVPLLKPLTHCLETAFRKKEEEDVKIAKRKEAMAKRKAAIESRMQSTSSGTNAGSGMGGGTKKVKLST